MKKGYLATCALMALNIIITAAFILFMPEEVPLNTSLSGEVDRIGSRYENFIMPILAIAIGVFLILIAKFGAKDNERVMVKANIGMQVFMIALAVVWFSSSLSFDATDLSGLFGFSVLKFGAIGFGVLLIAFGNMMPKSSINSVFGIRTHWSMSSEEVWQKTHRFGGYVCIISGLILVVFGVLLNGFLAILSMIVITTICFTICIVASYRIYKDSLE